MWDAGAGIKSGLEAAPKGLLSKREDESSRDTLSSVLVFTLPSRTGGVEKERSVLDFKVCPKPGLKFK